MIPLSPMFGASQPTRHPDLGNYITKSLNSVQYASSDGFVVVLRDELYYDSSVTECMIGSNPTPNILVAWTAVAAGFCVPVRKGIYWIINATNNYDLVKWVELA